MAILDVVKLDVASDDFIVQKFNSEKQWELALGSQLVVNEGQEAIFVKGGIALDLFTPGTHTLVSANIPLISGITNSLFGGTTPFTTEVWFINKTAKRDMQWGTPQRIPVMEATLGFPINVGACGQWGFRIADSRSFVTQIVGAQLMADSQKIYRYFIGEITEKFGQAINSILGSGTPFFSINSQLTAISDIVKKAVEEEFSRFGIELVNFTISSINIPPKEMAQIQAVMSKRMEMQQLSNVQVGQGYVTAKSFEVMQEAAKNTGAAGAVMGAATGLGLGIGAAVPMTQAMTNSVQPGIAPTASADSPVARLELLKQMYEKGLVTQEEYEQKRNKIINDL